MGAHDNLKPAPPVKGSTLPTANFVPMPKTMNFAQPWWHRVGSKQQICGSTRYSLTVNPLGRATTVRAPIHGR
jgi:hypothetical protein